MKKSIGLKVIKGIWYIKPKTKKQRKLAEEMFSIGPIKDGQYATADERRKDSFIQQLCKLEGLQ